MLLPNHVKCRVVGMLQSCYVVGHVQRKKNEPKFGTFPREDQKLSIFKGVIS